MFDLSNIKLIHMETSNICNAACPMCLRELPYFINSVPKKKSLTLEQVKALFSDSFIQNLDKMFMSGNYGDPACAPEAIEIMEHFRQLNSSMTLGFHSNGGVRDKAWWARLGKLMSDPERDYCAFGIDGLADTNHIYRVNTRFDKILENVQSFIDAGGVAHWHYLIFEHNEHQVQEAKALAKELGFAQFFEKVSFRFKSFPSIDLRPPLGEEHRDKM